MRSVCARKICPELDEGKGRIEAASIVHKTILTLRAER